METVNKYFADFTLQQQQQFEALASLYKEWNQKINVISRKDIDQFYEHHLLHSLTIATQFQFAAGSNVLDLGTGGGFPGIPLAILFPAVNFFLVDSINKKLMVVNEVFNALHITNIKTQHSRAEDLEKKKFDVVVSRAVASLRDLWHWSKPLLRKANTAEKIPNGLICLKGGDLTREIFESGCKPYVWEIEKIFKEPYFKKKFMLYQPLS